MLSKSLEDYLEIILILKFQSENIRVKDIVTAMNVKNSSVISALSKLEEQDMIQHEKYGSIKLTKTGFESASSIYSRHRLLSDFLNKILGSQINEAVLTACELEHILKGKNFDNLKRIMLFFEKYPKIFDKFKNFSIGAKKIKIDQQKISSNDISLYSARKDGEYIFWKIIDKNLKIVFPHKIKKGQKLHITNIGPEKSIFEIYSMGNYCYFTRDQSISIILKELK